MVAWLRDDHQPFAPGPATAVSGDRVETEVGGHRVALSHLDRVLFPETGYTKGQLVGYYTRIAPVLLPHLRDRPVTLRRFPGGVEGPGFFEKHLPAHAPGWVRSVTVPTGGTGGTGGTVVEYAVIDDLPSLVWAVNLDTVEFHVPLWHVGRRRNLPAPPDHLVFDLDPGPGTDLVDCCRVAFWIAEALGDDRRGVAGATVAGDLSPKTSGSKGLQLYAPLGGRPSWDRVKARAHGTATALEAAHPELVVSSMRKAVRSGRVLIDWSQNSPSKTTVAAYSVRARPEPTVSTPVSWEEVAACAEAGDPDVLRFTGDEVLARVEADGDRFAALGA
jgi:bifunctional non-homologous end joining protein LigD